MPQSLGCGSATHCRPQPAAVRWTALQHHLDRTVLGLPGRVEDTHTTLCSSVSCTLTSAQRTASFSRPQAAIACWHCPSSAWQLSWRALVRPRHVSPAVADGGHCGTLGYPNSPHVASHLLPCSLLHALPTATHYGGLAPCAAPRGGCRPPAARYHEAFETTQSTDRACLLPP